ncbi:TonB-dependent siderophore receptor [Capnocytophaga sp. oral taxon 878]|uniref:TonB-dependent receptor plug domain-containing protein n=1 Tax=Capnocytophaga sp. oral taxon 878 TaxID=1316596 RepID=UPI000D045F2E|nr:TonB-dependent receptor [Capnocytophaga sp. oral taxon 878]AVM51231.1 TonB-dependent receptor [Capnocytophaga sp. oral taxon 878]
MKSLLFYTYIFCLTLFVPLTISAQNEKEIKLDEVVVSGQIAPQSATKAVKNVQVITKEQIKAAGATHLGDVLNQYVNITVLPDAATGKEKVSLYGLGANYFKIFIDNIPLVNEDGLGVNTDLSQINIDEVERIEIIEGAMGVTHGANAVTGIMNIITKKSARNKWDITYTLQEESLTKEYNLLNKGKHYLSFRAATNLSKRWFTSLGMNRTNFNGFWGKYKGKNHEKMDGLRGFERAPYFLYQTNFLTYYQTPQYKLMYKFDYMKDQYNSFDRTTEKNYSPLYGDYTFGDDRRDYYLRNSHILNLNGKNNFIKYDFSIAYQYQERFEEKFRYLIDYRTELNNEKQKNQSMDVWYSTGAISHAFGEKKHQVEIGYEAAHNQGYAVLKDEGSTLKIVDKAIDNYDGYISSEINITPKLSIRPGVRYSIQKLFNNQYAYSLGARYTLPANIQLRASAGQAYRTPSFQELYVRNIFVGHVFLGNENLTPERSYSAELNLKKLTSWGDKGHSLLNNLSFSINRINDKIENLLLSVEGGMPRTQYMNVSRFKNNNIISTNTLHLNNIDFTLSGAFVWVSQTDDMSVVKRDNRYLLNINADAGITWRIPKTQSIITAKYKFTGKSQMWMAANDGAALGNLSPYGHLNFSYQQYFWKKRIEFIAGARNLLNIINVNLTQTSLSGVVTERDFPVGNGRAFYFKLAYNLNINY